MATSPKAFLVELYREYLDDASFLHDQCQALREDAEVSWRDLESFEERLEACLDGLMVGGQLALEVAQVRAEEGDAGELYAAACVFCRHSLRSVVMGLVKGLSPDASPRIDALADALKQECPETWFEELFNLALGRPENESLLMLAARVFGYRHWKSAAPMLVALLPNAPASATPDLIWALGHIGVPDSHSLLVAKLHDPDQQVRAKAAYALLCQGNSIVADLCLRAAPAEGWAAILSGLAGGKTATELLLTCARGSTSQREAISALGLLGDVSAVPELIELLIKGLHPIQSVQSLELITGASLYETVFVPEPGETSDNGDVAAPVIRPDGKAYGSTVNRLAQDPERWQQWWRQNEREFNPQLRYRQGQPCSPEVLLSIIESPRSPACIRQWAADELRIRYAFDWRFELEMAVNQQVAVIETARLLVRQESAGFISGAFYFGGKLQ